MPILLNNAAPNATVQDPTVVAARNPGNGDIRFFVGQIWINSVTQAAFILMGNTAGLPVWEGLGSTSGGSITGDDITITPGPSSFTGVFTVVGDVDQASVISLTETGGTSGTIVIQSAQGTSATSVQIQSVSGGIQIVTNSASGDIEINSNLGTVTLESAENSAENVLIQSAGGAAATMRIQNTTGTTTAIGGGSLILSTGSGGLFLSSGADFILGGVTSSSILVTGASEDISLGTTNGNILVTANGVGGGLLLQANEVAADAIQIDSVAGGIEATADLDISAISTSGSIVLTAGEAATDSIDINTAAGGGIDIDGGTLGIAIDTTGVLALNSAAASEFIVTGAGLDLTLESVGGSVAIKSDEAVGTAIDLDASAGGFSIDGVLASNITITGAAADLTISGVGGSVNISSDEAVVDALTITASAGGMEVTSDNMTLDNTQVIFDVTTSAAIGTAATVTTIDLGNVAPTSNRTTTIAGGAVITAVTDIVNIATGGLNTDAGASKVANIASGANLLGTTTVNIGSGNAGSGTHAINIGTGTGGATKSISLGNADDLTTVTVLGSVALNNGTSTGTIVIGNALAGAITIDTAAGVSVDAAAASNFSTSGAGIDLTLLSSAGRVIVDGGEAAINAIQLDASDAAGGIDINAGTGGITVDSGDTISLDAAAASNFSTSGAGIDLTLASAAGRIIVDGGEAAINAIQLDASNAAGGIDINAGTGGITIDSGDTVAINSAAASNFTVAGFDLTLRSTGAAVVVSSTQAAADAIQLTCTDASGGVTIALNGGQVTLSNGDLEVSTATKGVILGSGTKLVDGAGDPNGVVTAAQGSLYLRTDGSSTSTRAYINTNSGTAWTAMTTAS